MGLQGSAAAPGRKADSGYEAGIVPAAHVQHHPRPDRSRRVISGRERDSGDYPQVGPGQKDEPFKFIERDSHHSVAYDFENRRLEAVEGRVPDDQTLLSLATGPFGNAGAVEFRDRLASWRIYHDVHVNQDASIRQPSVSRREKVVAPDGQNLVTVLHTLYSGDREFKRSLNATMSAAFGGDFDELVFPPDEADQKVQLRLRWRSLQSQHSLADLSDGTIRFLLLVAILANPESGDVIAFDEPETGLHPAMLPLVAELAVDAATRSQVIFTTHSAEFLDAFQDTLPTTTVAEWSDGETRLNVVDQEELARWLKEYSLGALFRSKELEAIT